MYYENQNLSTNDVAPSGTSVDSFVTSLQKREPLVCRETVREDVTGRGIPLQWRLAKHTLGIQ